MIRAVVDPGILVSALLTPGGVPALLVTAWRQGTFQLIACPTLLTELTDVLLRPKFRGWIDADDAVRFIEVVRLTAIMVEDPEDIEAISRDPDDDYLIALARSSGAHIVVSGDRDLTSFRDLAPPVVTPRAFLATIEGPRDA